MIYKDAAAKNSRLNPEKLNLSVLLVLPGATMPMGMLGIDGNWIAELVIIINYFYCRYDL